MKLIDKEQILYMIDNIDRVVALKNEIDDIPIIEAIPIDWIEKWEREQTDGEYSFELITDLIEDWRKENNDI